MHNLQKRVYENSPIFFQNLMTSLEGYRKTRSRYGDIYYSFLLELENLQSVNEKEARRYQALEMRKLLQHAVENSPFYRNFYNGIDLSEIQTVEDLKKLPVLDKETLQKNIDSLYTVSEKSGALTYVSYRTGMPIRFLFTKGDIQKRNAFLDFFKKQHGAVNLEMKRASFTSDRFIPLKQQKKVFWRDNYYMKQRLYASQYCTARNAAAFVADLDKYKPDFIDGLPSAIYEVAKYINENKVFLSFKPVAIFASAEKLYPHYRREIEEAFACPVRDIYCSPEGAPFIMECTKGKLHYNLNSGVIETAPDGEMIVTCFNTYGTPLIRYGIGDRLEMPQGENKCECGSVYPVVGRIHSQTAEIIKSKNKGNVSHIPFTGIQMDFPIAFKHIPVFLNPIGGFRIASEKVSGFKENVTAKLRQIVGSLSVGHVGISERAAEEIVDLPEKKNFFPGNNFLNGKYS